MRSFLTFRLAVFAGFSAIVFLGWCFFSTPPRNSGPIQTSAHTNRFIPPPPPSHSKSQELPAEPETPGILVSSRPAAAREESKHFPIQPLEPRVSVEKTLSDLEEIGASYNVSRVPEIVPYLRSENSEIRAAATDALVTLGHPSGAEAIQQAAKIVTDPREAEAMLQKAAFLRLPSGRLSSGKRGKDPLPPPVSPKGVPQK